MLSLKICTEWLAIGPKKFTFLMYLFSSVIESAEFFNLFALRGAVVFDILGCGDNCELTNYGAATQILP